MPYENLELARLRERGAPLRQQNRMIMDKKRAFHKALMYSYQAGLIKKDAIEGHWCPALINPDKIKFDYDEKIISVDWEEDFHCGDTFEWPKDSNIHWIILKQELTEKAYFRGNIRRCQFIEAVDPETKEPVPVWAAIRGPVETTVQQQQSSKILVDKLNLSLNIYIPDNLVNRRTFARYQKFQFQNRWWQVQAPDSISTPGIINFEAMEDYAPYEDFLYPAFDDNKPVKKNDPQINGPSFIKPFFKNHFEVLNYDKEGSWIIDWINRKGKEPKDVFDYKIDGKHLYLTWTMGMSGEFILKYGELEKTVVVESLL